MQGQALIRFLIKNKGSIIPDNPASFLRIMKQMTLQDIQAISLEILKHLHDFCVANNIKYSLGYGTLIGAVRHKGIIPWDDDIDVVMMREDYERFCLVYEDSSNYKLFSFNRRNTYSSVARLCDMKKTIVKTGTPLFTEPTGVWIDIFPFDSVDDDKMIFEQRRKEISEAHSSVVKCRYEMRKWNGIKDMVLHIRGFVSWLLNVRKARKRIWDIVEQQNKLCVSFAPSTNKMMSILAFPTYIDRDYTPKKVFERVIDATFEGNQYKIMEGYDQWLTIVYGDYMTPPPVQKQTRGHQVHAYYWK